MAKRILRSCLAGFCLHDDNDDDGEDLLSLRYELVLIQISRFAAANANYLSFPGVPNQPHECIWNIERM